VERTIIEHKTKSTTRTPPTTINKKRTIIGITSDTIR
jgi:hypothetical protein